jgi:hypothetical protein
MISHRVAALGLPLVLLASAPSAAAVDRAQRSPALDFSSALLLPGQSVDGDITIAGGDAGVNPFLKVAPATQSCAVPACSTNPPSLAQMLQLSVVNGAHAWRGTLAQAQGHILLPGGGIKPGQHRTYVVTLSLPARAGNAYEGLVARDPFSWGGKDDTGVLGAGGTRGTGKGSKGDGQTTTGRQGHSLPFTGFNALVDVGVALSLVAVGMMLITAARRRRRA